MIVNSFTLPGGIKVTHVSKEHSKKFRVAPGKYRTQTHYSFKITKNGRELGFHQMEAKNLTQLKSKIKRDF